MTKVLEMYNKMKAWPLGKSLFSLSFSVWAPYFLTIRPMVEELGPGKAVVSLKQRWGVQNHIKTVHAIAVCNLVEMAKKKLSFFFYTQRYNYKGVGLTTLRHYFSL